MQNINRDVDSMPENVRKLGTLLKDIKVAMMTSVRPNGALHSRPMMTQQVDFDGTLWFFTNDHSPKVDELSQDMRINLAYADPDDNRYVSVCGVASVVHDRQKIQELWTPAHKAWFPKGVDDPELALVRVDVESAEYWDAPSSKLVQLVGFAKALATGQEFRPGENEKLNLAG